MAHVVLGLSYDYEVKFIALWVPDTHKVVCLFVLPKLEFVGGLMFNEQFKHFFGFFGVDLKERFEYLQELISNNLAIGRIFESPTSSLFGSQLQLTCEIK